ITRIITGVGHDACSPQVRFSFVFAAEFQKGNCEWELSCLPYGWTAKNGSENPGDTGAELIFAGLGCLRRTMPQSHVAKFVGHHAGPLPLITRRFNHAAIDIHWPARQRKSINVPGIHHAKVIAEFGML